MKQLPIREKLNTMKKLLILAALAASLSLANAQLVWNFNNNPVTSSADPNTFGGTATLTLSGSNVIPGGTTGTAFTDALGNSHSAGLAGSFGQDGGNDSAVTWTFDTTGKSSFELSFDYRSASATPIAMRLDYRIGESGDWSTQTDFGIEEDGDWHRLSIPITSLINNTGIAQLRLTTFQEIGPRSNLTWDIDNAQLTAVPEPAESAAYVGVGLLVLALWRNRHRIKAVAQ